MPTYIYFCDACETITEVQHLMPLKGYPCANCGKLAHIPQEPSQDVNLTSSSEITNSAEYKTHLSSFKILQSAWWSEKRIIKFIVGITLVVILVYSWNQCVPSYGCYTEYSDGYAYQICDDPNDKDFQH